jgi:hypothetical protein
LEQIDENIMIDFMAEALLIVAIIAALMFLLNYISYQLMKQRILKRQTWDLNICCGKTDGGGVNADIMAHAPVNNYCHLDDIYNLPFADKQFEHVLCSHTIEHVEDPELFDIELRRVGKHVTYVLPPIWDVSAAFNFFEHRWLFLTLRKEHSELPPYTKLLFSHKLQSLLGQRINA